jgi:DNA modification methylase
MKAFLDGPKQRHNRRRPPMRNLFDTHVSEPMTKPVNENKRSGPPNRMNDLAYRDWMKFQKSFFRFRDWKPFVEECVAFFTKEQWPDRQISKSLIMGFSPPSKESLGERSIEVSDAHGPDAIVKDLVRRSAAGEKFDFVLINLISRGRSDAFDISGKAQTSLFESIRNVLAYARYCGIVTQWDARSFPAPWALATNGRRFLKLRDEKIGLTGQSQSSYYCLFFQADDDISQPELWSPDETQTANIKGAPFPTWVMPKSPPRKADEIHHPGKFPERLVAEFIQAFSEPGDTVLDPMMGTGSTLVASLRSSRHALGIDLNPKFVSVARDRVKAETHSLLDKPSDVEIKEGDARDVVNLIGPRMVDYCVTSPPYWSMLSNQGSENQQARRERNLPTVYSDSDTDLGNIGDYNRFIDTLVDIYNGVGEKLKRGGYLTVVVKNIKRNHTVYPLGWDLVRRLAAKGSKFEFAGTTLWCQDDVGLKPFAVGIYWVSNTLHTYCLHFRRR